MQEKNPDAVVHPVSPQRQGAVLDVVPSVSRQLGAERQRQKSEFWEQGGVEVVTGLYLKLVPVQEHPGGTYEYESFSTTTSLKPKLVAAASQVTLSDIDFLPATALHLPLIGLGYPNAPTSFLRQEPPPFVE